MDNGGLDPCNVSCTLPSAEALIAGTFALMTGYAQAGSTCPRRLLLARKLISNLGSLAEHPQMSASMQTVLARLQGHWLGEVARTGEPAAREATHLWHSLGLQ